MNKIVPVFLLAAASCMISCSDDQDVEKGEVTEGVVALTVHVKQVDKISGDLNSGVKLEGAVEKGVANLNTTPEDKIVEINTDPETQQRGIRVNDFMLRVLNKDQATLDAELKDFVCEFQSNKDGFISSVKSMEKCPPQPCSNLKHVYFNADTGNIIHDMDSSCYKAEMNGTNGCYKVTMVPDGSEGINPLTNEKYQASVLIYKAPENSDETEHQEGNADNIQSYTIKVTIDDNAPIEVDIADLKDKVSDGKLLISDVIKKAKSDISLDQFNCDYAASDGFKASKREECKNASCTNAEKMYFEVATVNENHNVSTDTLANCFGVKSLSDIIITTIPTE